MDQQSISNTGATQCAAPRRHAACRNAAMSKLRFSGSAKRSKFVRLAKITFFFLCFTQFAQAQLDWSGQQTLTAGSEVDKNITLTGDVIIEVASGEVHINGVISGKYTLTKTGAGILSLNAENTYTGVTTVSAGTLRLGNGAIDGNIASTASVSVASKAYFEFAPKGGIYFNRVISGDGGVKKWGPGTAVLAQKNTYTGDTYIGSGTLQVDNGWNNGDISSTSGVTIEADGVLHFVPPVQTHFSKEIRGAGKVVYDGGSGSGKMLILSADNTYSGGTTIKAGVLQIGAGGNTGSVTGNIENNGGIHFARNDDFIHNGVISGTGYVAKFGIGTLILGGNNTYYGSTNIQGGTLELDGTIENSAGVNFVDDGDFALSLFEDRKIKSLNSKWAKSRVRFPPFNVSLTIGTAELNDGGGTFAGIISGSGNVTKTGSAKLTLTGANTYTGSTTVNGGTLQIGNGTSGSINSTNNVVVNSGGILRFEPGAATEFTKVISGAGRVEYKGTNEKTLTFTAPNTYTGTTTNEAGRMIIEGSMAGDIINKEWLIFKHTANTTYSKVISGAGSVAKYGAARLTLDGANTYTGDTHIYEGNLALGTNGSIENSRSVVLADAAAKLDISAGNKKVKGLNSVFGNSEVILGARILTIGTAGKDEGNATFAGIISGTGGITKTGTNILNLNGNNIYTGGTTISEGFLILGAMGTTGRITGNIVNNADFIYQCANNHTYSDIISGTGNVLKYGTGTLTLNNVNTYTGYTYITEGTLALGASGSIENSMYAILTDNSAKFSISAGNKTIKGLNSAYAYSEVILGARTLTIGTQGQNDGTGTFTGKFTGTGGVFKTGTGTFTMNGDHTATGTLSIAGGTLNMSNSWEGAFSQATNTTWGITGTVSIRGKLTLAGGNINMTLTQATPSKITVTGAVEASGKTTLNITSGAVTNRVLIQAASGISNISNFTANVPGYTPTLSATGTYLMLTTAVAKTVAAGTQNGILTAGTAGTVTFPVTTANIANGNYAATVANLPAGVTVQGQVTVNNNSGTLTLAGNASTVAGTTNTLRLTIDGTQSAVFTLTVSAAAAKTVSIGTQNGILTAGTAGTVTFPVTTANIANGNYAATVANLPAGVTVQGQVAINNNAGTLTLAGNTSTIAGTTNTLRLTIDGTQSTAVFTLTISAVAVKTVSVGTQNGILTAGKAGTVTFPVTTANIANGSYSATVANLPAGISLQGQVTVNNNSGTLTLAGNTSTVTGTTNTLRLNIDGTQSAAFTLTVSAAVAKTVSVGTQNGILTAGKAGTITFPVTTANIANGSYSATVANLPTGLTVQGQVAINNNAGTLTLSGNTSTVAGTTNTLRLTIDNTQSATFTLTIEAAVVKTVSVGAQEGTLTAGTAGSITLPVTTENIANGSYEVTITNLPAGVTVQGQVTISNNAGVLTLTGNTTMVAGTTNTLKLTIDGTQSATFTLTIGAGVTGTEDLLKIDVELFPNPFTSELRLKGAEGCTLRVFTATGAVVYVQKITNSDESLRLGHLPAGVYFFRLEMDGKAKTMKVVKN